MKNDKAQRRKEAELLLAWVKFSPEMGPPRVKPGVLPLKGERGRSRVIKLSVDEVDFPDWKNHTRYAAFAFGTEHSKEIIKKAVAAHHKQFFIDLGNCLQCKPRLMPQLWDESDIDIAEIVLESLARQKSGKVLKAKEAVEELKKRGHEMTEEAFRQQKKKLLQAKRNFDGFKWLLGL
jgi:Zn ribbon nucleic-acid-binding protein